MEIIKPDYGKGYGISIRDWNRLKSNIEKIKREGSFWNNFSWACLSTGVGIVITCLTQILIFEEWYWFASGALISFGIMGLYIYHKQAGEVISTKNQVLDQMESIEERFLPNENALKIFRATYGIGDEIYDVTNHLNNRIIDNSLSFVVDNKIAGDPAPMKGKKIHIEYSIKGQRTSVEFPENSNVIIDEAGARIS